jgi:hypothetical protein
MRDRWTLLRYDINNVWSLQLNWPRRFEKDKYHKYYKMRAKDIPYCVRQEMKETQTDWISTTFVSGVWTGAIWQHRGPLTPTARAALIEFLTPYALAAELLK